MRHTPEDEPHFLIRSMRGCLRDGVALAPHAHPWGQLLYTVSGVLTVWTEHGTWIVPPQLSLWAPRGVKHGVRASGAAEMRTLYFAPSLAGQPEASTVIAVSPLLRELVLRAVEVGMLDRRVSTHASITKLILAELEARPTPPLDLVMPQSLAIRPVAEYVMRTPSSPEGSDALARRFGMSLRSLQRGFTAETGLSLGRWRQQARLFHALRLLGAGQTVKAVAAEAGYRSASAFVAAFRSVFHTTPARYFGRHSQDADADTIRVGRRYRSATSPSCSESAG